MKSLGKSELIEVCIGALIDGGIEFFLARWITAIESQLRDNDGLRKDLETKGDQLDSLRAIDYDIVTRTYEIDKIQEFLQAVEEDRLDKVWEKLVGPHTVRSSQFNYQFCSYLSTSFSDSFMVQS